MAEAGVHRGPYHHFPARAHILAVQCWYKCGEKTGPAAKALAAALQAEGIKCSNVHSLLSSTVQRFEQHGSAAPITHQNTDPLLHAKGSQSKMTEAEARICAEALATGKVVDGAVVRPFDSIRDAWANSPTLQSYMAKCGYSAPNHMYEAMQRLCGEAICKVALDMKEPHTAAHRQQRKEAAQQLLALLDARPDALLHTFYFDVVHVHLRPSDAPSYGFYIHPNDAHSRHWVADIPSTLLAKDIRLNFLAAVNAKLGPVFIEFVSGTTEAIDFRLHWTGAPPVYFVSHNAPHCPATACTCSCSAMYAW